MDNTAGLEPPPRPSLASVPRASVRTTDPGVTPNPGGADGNGDVEGQRTHGDVTAELNDPTDGRRRAADSGVVRFFREWGVVLAVALAVAVVVRVFLFSPFYIPSGSMEPTLRVHDKILVNKLSYKLHDVRRGDVIVFDSPPTGNFGPDVKDLVKRVIGLPGDSVEIHDCSVFINNQKLVEPYISHDPSGNPVCTDGADRIVDLDGDGKIQVPAGMVFVMGDNRRPNQSYDSRKWGFLDEHLIVGRAFVIYWPIGHWSWL